MGECEGKMGECEGKMGECEGKIDEWEGKIGESRRGMGGSEGKINDSRDHDSRTVGKDKSTDEDILGRMANSSQNGMIFESNKEKRDQDGGSVVEYVSSEDEIDGEMDDEPEWVTHWKVREREANVALDPEKRRQWIQRYHEEAAKTRERKTFLNVWEDLSYHDLKALWHDLGKLSESGDLLSRELYLHCAGLTIDAIDSASKNELLLLARRLFGNNLMQEQEFFVNIRNFFHMFVHYGPSRPDFFRTS
eukprot:g3507.t1